MPPLYAKGPYAGRSISGYSAYVPMHACMLSSVLLFVTLWTVVRQAPLSMGFSRPEYWSRLPFPTPGDLPDPGIKPTSLGSPELAGGFFTNCTTWEAPYVPMHAS